LRGLFIQARARRRLRCHDARAIATTPAPAISEDAGSGTLAIVPGSHPPGGLTGGVESPPAGGVVITGGVLSPPPVGGGVGLSVFVFVLGGGVLFPGFDGGVVITLTLFTTTGTLPLRQS
jgi:hypothetical protein